GANPRRTAPRREVSAALRPVLRYLIDRARAVREFSKGTPPRQTRDRAVPRPAACNAPKLHNSGAAPKSAWDSNAPQSPAAARPSSAGKPRARALAWGRSNTARSKAAAPPPKPPDTPPSFAAASVPTNYSPYKSRFPWCPAPTVFLVLAPAPPTLHPACGSLPRDTAPRAPHILCCP